jgi:CRP/FNR family cyclic AMP-dependent transcriptional regulator
VAFRGRRLEHRKLATHGPSVNRVYRNGLRRRGTCSASTGRVILQTMSSDAKLDMLHSIPLFARLGKSELLRLGQLADEVDMPAGKVLVREGDNGSQMFVIASGRVSVDQGGKVIRELGPGDWFGEIALISEGPRTASVTTTEPSQLFVVAHREFHALMDEVPSVRMSVLECLADRLRKAEDNPTN